MKITIKVSGMTCQNCVRHVKEAVTEVPGVINAEVSLEKGASTVEHDGSVTFEALASAVSEAGYQATEV